MKKKTVRGIMNILLDNALVTKLFLRKEMFVSLLDQPEARIYEKPQMRALNNLETGLFRELL